MADRGRGPALPLADARRWRALAVVVAQFMFVVDAFVVNLALPSVAAALHAGPGEVEAVIAVYQAAYAALVITGGRPGDRAWCWRRWPGWCWPTWRRHRPGRRPAC